MSQPARTFVLAQWEPAMMAAARGLQEAKMRLDAEVLRARGVVSQIRFFAVSIHEPQAVLVCCEMTDGTSIDCLTLLDFEIDPDPSVFDEARLADLLMAMPSSAKHWRRRLPMDDQHAARITAFFDCGGTVVGVDENGRKWT